MELRTLGLLLMVGCLFAVPTAAADGPPRASSQETLASSPPTQTDADTGPDPGNPCRPYCLM